MGEIMLQGLRGKTAKFHFELHLLKMDRQR